MGKKSRTDDGTEDLSPAPESPAETSTDAPDVDRLQAEVQELRSKWLRAQADYQNLRRRGEVEQGAFLRLKLEPLLRDLLFVLDWLDMALSTPVESDDAKALRTGVEMTRDKLLGALEGEDVRPIADGGRFDPDRHEATATEERADLEPGTVVRTVRRGYTWRDAILRHAHVVVARRPEDPASGRGPDTPDEER